MEDEHCTFMYRLSLKEMMMMMMMMMMKTKKKKANLKFCNVKIYDITTLVMLYIMLYIIIVITSWRNRCLGSISK